MKKIKSAIYPTFYFNDFKNQFGATNKLEKSE